MQYDQRSNTALWTRLQSYGTSQSLKRNAQLYSVEQEADKLYLLRKGQISLQMTSSDGRTLTLQVIEPNQLFGHMALIEKAHYDTHALATRPSEVLAIPQKRIRKMMLEQPELAIEMLKLVSEYRSTISRRLDEVAFKPVPARLASILLDMSDDSEDPAPVRLPRRTHQQLAQMINAYRETVTKVINQFRAARLLDVDRSGITLLNPSRLREISDNSAF
jgi:CRP-like cAMP-binding protein